MTISLASAIKSFTEDEHWVKKCIIGGLVIILAGFSQLSKDNLHNGSFSIMLICSILMLLGILANFYYTGFWILTGNKMINSDKGIMAEWTENNIFLKGFIFCLLNIIYSLLLFFIGIVIFLSAGIVLALIGVVGYFVLSAMPNIGINMFKYFIILLISLDVIITVLYSAQFFNAMFASFYKKLEWADMFNIVKHFNIIKNNCHAAWTLIGKQILYMLLFVLVLFFLAVSILGIVLLPFVCFIATIVYVNLLAQYGKHIEIENYS